jgi:AraC-like DNA-binding protein
VKLIDIFFILLRIIPEFLQNLPICLICDENLSVSATQLIQQRVLLEAKRLLQSTDLSIKEIAFELGFIDHAYFSNFFKNQTKATPTEFREKAF